MIRHIFKQLWFYKKKSAWLLIESFIIFTCSWFIINSLWERFYVSNLEDRGFDTRDCWVLTLHNGGDGQDIIGKAETDMINDYLKNLPEILYSAPADMTYPGLYSNNNYIIYTDSTNQVLQRTIDRQSGAGDLDVIGIKTIFPADGKISDAPGTVIISEDIARKFFPGENPVGKIVRSNYGNSSTYIVSGVINSIIEDCMSDTSPVPVVMYNQSNLNEAIDDTPIIIFRTRPGCDSEKLNGMITKDLNRMLESCGYMVEEITSYEGIIQEMSRMFDRSPLLYIILVFLIINAFLSIASYTWLSLETRKQETGLRKAVGGTSAAIRLQYLTEAIILCITAIVIGIAIILNIILILDIDIATSTQYCASIPETIKEHPLLYDSTARFIAITSIAVVISIITAAISSVIPTVKSLKASPTETLKEE
ncbi:MAG TPA: ABC transporter permease [Candidatus Coprenecus stercoripullorum]|nr:ABC transporter permease [Candidatus Coprenecus stercoripullorum]